MSFFANVYRNLQFQFSVIFGNIKNLSVKFICSELLKMEIAWGQKKKKIKEKKNKGKKKKWQQGELGSELRGTKDWLYLLHCLGEGWLLTGMLFGYQGSCSLEGASSQCHATTIATSLFLGQRIPSLKVWSFANYCCSQALCRWDYVLQQGAFLLIIFCKTPSIKDTSSSQVSHLELLSILPHEPLWDPAWIFHYLLCIYWNKMLITTCFFPLYIFAFTFWAEIVFPRFMWE